MRLPLYIIDAFTQVPFKGNQAAVVLSDELLSVAVMQNIASENNLSETAFVFPKHDGRYHIRWFSPLCEIDFCGHATLASAFVLFQRGYQGELVFSTEKVGELRVTVLPDGEIKMRFPARRAQPVDSVPKALLDGLSLAPESILRSPQAWFAVYRNQSQIEQLCTISAELKRLAPYDVVATAPASEQGVDFVSRYFWPANGSDEDPVTGSIHAGLAPYWAERLNKYQLQARQLSTRGGQLSCTVEDQVVWVSGYGVLYLSGEIDVAV